MCFIAWIFIRNLRYKLPVGNTKTPPMPNYFNYFITEDAVSGGAKQCDGILHKIFRGR